MKLLRLNDSPFIGNFALATNEYLLLPPHTPPKVKEDFEEELGVKAQCVTVGESNLIGLLACGNSKGLIVSPYTSDFEIKQLEKITRVRRLPSILSAVGNIILANDDAALVHPKLSDECIELIADFLDVDVWRGTIANLRTVGAMAVATGRGILVNPDITDNELSRLSALFGLTPLRGSANFGSGVVGSSIVANDHGCVAGSDTTAVEVMRIEDALEL
ncbi:translation initiation factor IF-6 [Methanosarcinales archaeon]|nr:MAG: translation initiation factor IF-6 [Methanosarcinales archaeon]